MNHDIKQQIVHMAQKCFAEGLFAEYSGNISVFDPDTGIMAITPTSLPYKNMGADDIVCITLDGKRVSGERQPSSEWPMHAVVYREYPDIRAQIHTHSVYASSFSVNNMGIPVILTEMVPLLGGDVKVAEFALPGTNEVGDSAVFALKDRYACLLANHGVLAVGVSLEQAHMRAVCIENAARVYSAALTNGPIRVISDETVRVMLGR